MEIEIVSTKDNPLLKRREVQFKIQQGPQSKTPNRLEVKRTLANTLKISEDQVFVKDMRTLTGTATTVGHANAYESAQQARYVEPNYIVKRNSPKEKKEEEA